MSTDILAELEAVLAERKTADPDSSYVASLYAKGLDSILKKVGEEATELVIAAKSGDTGDVVHECADLWFHSLVMLSHMGISQREIMDELSRRFGTSGHEEKASR